MPAVSLRLVITGGGTGGHLFPGIALAQGLMARTDVARLLFIGTDRQIDKVALDGLEFDRAVLNCAGLKGKGLPGTLTALFRLPLALLQAWRILRDFRPNLVFGVGGYVTGPVLLAARLLRVPVCIHEQNSVPGLANRLVSRVATRIFLAIPCTPAFPRSKSVLAGNPVRSAILQAAATKRPFLPDKTQVTLLVLGGSQGAHRVNLLLVSAVKILLESGHTEVDILHQTGSADEEFVRKAYDALGVKAKVQPFFTDMAGCYQQVDLVVSRAGATTLAELAVMGLPAVLIPYPHAADDHQTGNARHYAAKGGALVLEEDELTGQQLGEQLSALLDDRKKLAMMGAAMKELAVPQATSVIVESCLELLKKR
ncbi:MAG: undecaprenyldiphospho-muramoylpentapeptide beta-N-acetylglucosaminyltransferase [Desulfobulbus propionicus]|nr:MAG: undecaprenyldiphospho-muramoylpentapeptide beta-N-acetylglucosaminyltransferase [Desulfobulbus propionicus]